jgi:oligopeptide/dipeptide ABC transporter ATP-binding protein
MMTDTILHVDDLTTHFETEQGTVKAVDGVSFELNAGETLGVVGESGSGKSVTAMTMMGLIGSAGNVKRGSVRFGGEDLLEKPESELQKIRGTRIAMVFQDPMTSLNPTQTIGKQITRVIRTHQDHSKAEAKAKTVDLMEQVGIPEAESRVDNYPHQFSGGMRQRALIAMAISCEPDVLIADEPTTALDVTIESQIFDLLDDLQEEYDMSILLITHDLGVVAGTCDRVNVMYAGRIVEKGSREEIFTDPRHPYTRGLLRSIPQLRSAATRLMPIEGDVPNPASLPSGCSFNPRCPHAEAECSQYDPELRSVTQSQEAACLLAEGYGGTPATEEPEAAARTGGGDR